MNPEDIELPDPTVYAGVVLATHEAGFTLHAYQVSTHSTLPELPLVSFWGLGPARQAQRSLNKRIKITRRLLGL